MDTEEHFEYDTMEKLAELAENREKWNLEVRPRKVDLSVPKFFQSVCAAGSVFGLSD